MPGNQLAAQLLPEELSPENKDSIYCDFCSRCTSTKRLLLAIQECRVVLGDIAAKPCAPNCPTHAKLQAAVSTAVAHRPGLVECYCPVHKTLDVSLALKAESEHARYLGFFATCGCPASLKDTWCPKCKHFQAQVAQFFCFSDGFDKLTPAQLAWVRWCPSEHVNACYRD